MASVPRGQVNLEKFRASWTSLYTPHRVLSLTKTLFLLLSAFVRQRASTFISAMAEQDFGPSYHDSAQKLTELGANPPTNTWDSAEVDAWLLNAHSNWVTCDTTWSAVEDVDEDDWSELEFAALSCLQHFPRKLVSQARAEFNAMLVFFDKYNITVSPLVLRPAVSRQSRAPSMALGRGLSQTPRRERLQDKSTPAPPSNTGASTSIIQQEVVPAQSRHTTSIPPSPKGTATLHEKPREPTPVPSPVTEKTPVPPASRPPTPRRSPSKEKTPVSPVFKPTPPLFSTSRKASPVPPVLDKQSISAQDLFDAPTPPAAHGAKDQGVDQSGPPAANDVRPGSAGPSLFSTPAGWGTSAWSPPLSQLNSPFGSQNSALPSTFDFHLPQDSPLRRPTRPSFVEEALSSFKDSKASVTKEPSSSTGVQVSDLITLKVPPLRRVPSPAASQPDEVEDTTMNNAKTPPPLPEDETMDVDSPPPTRRIAKTSKPAPNPIFEDSIPDNDDTVVIPSPRTFRDRTKHAVIKPGSRVIKKTSSKGKGKAVEVQVPSSKKRKVSAIAEDEDTQTPQFPDAKRTRGRAKNEPPPPTRGISGGGFGEPVPKGMTEVSKPRTSMGVLMLSKDFGSHVEVDGRLWAADIAPFVLEAYSYSCDRCKKAGTHCRALQRSGCVCARCVYTKSACTFNGKKLLCPRIPYRPDPVQYDAIVGARNLIAQHMDAIARIISDIFRASNLQEHVDGLRDCVNSLWGAEALAEVMAEDEGIEDTEAVVDEEVDEDGAGPSTT
ncbi:uncharacterized protein EV420DRAFT_1752849 [Desarmillaria tabescens]|uniref:Zn(2)-C6 fungal-type domain-containing protein n=1 Tax=Armillaria tabescens TaxID=1929756 RepID=A0AA39MLY9_ARMTA|nr:uncharacterized protein EV420DRAFT_1752849 [Desarmillaria tabescens]KAK0439711.1 hypothetical protein EV420DRAFT_1752849 [Desarmillaria tabescens]